MTEIDILDKSYTDDSIFFHHGHGTILRKLDEKNEFLADPKTRELLVDNGVVEYQVSSYEGNNYLEVEPFFFPNCAANWSYAMYDDYLQLYKKLRGALKTRGLRLIDGHCFNVLFYYSVPKFVDLGSIQPGDGRDGYRELKKYKKVLTSYRISSAPFTRRRLDSELEAPKYLDVIKDILFKDGYVGRKHKLWRLFGFSKQTSWSQYYDGSPDIYHDRPKEAVLETIFNELKPKTVYDIGSNTGHYAFIAESFGASVVACDPDPDCIDYLYKRAKQDNLRILPLVADIDGFIRAIERSYEYLRPKTVDSVLMLALIHHLVFRFDYSFEDVFAKARQMGAKSLVLEFVSKKDVNVGHWDQKSPKDWYSLERLLDVSRDYFREHKVYEEHDAERPVILFSGAT